VRAGAERTAGIAITIASVLPGASSHGGPTQKRPTTTP
jgi:hypothetical protein